LNNLSFTAKAQAYLWQFDDVNEFMNFILIAFKQDAYCSTGTFMTACQARLSAVSTTAPTPGTDKSGFHTPVFSMAFLKVGNYG
jgi:hypothetical protein